MTLIRTFKEKQQAQRQAAIRQQAVDTIRLSDFDNEIYISYNGTPLVEVDSSWTSHQIIEELAKLRGNFINSRMKECGLHKIAAVL